MSRSTRHVDDVAECVDATLQRHGGRIVLALPIGVGKSAVIANEFYRRASRDAGIDLRIFTALSLGRPAWHSELERRFLEPLGERLFGGTLELDYLRDLRAGRVPANVQVTEFFLEPGSALGIAHSQRHYISSNYTHVVRDLQLAGVNVIAQRVARRGPEGRAQYSLGSNPDITVDLLRAVEESRLTMIGEVSRQMPYMFGDAEVETGCFDYLLEHPRYDSELFAPPNPALATADHAIGVQVAALVRDGGTLQVGIGALGDAVVYALQLRHQQNGEFRDILRALDTRARAAGLIESCGGDGVFEEGLYGCSEMLVDGFLDLYRSGVLKRRVYEDLRLQQLLTARRINERIDAAMLAALAESGLRGVFGASEFASLQRAGLFRRECQWQDGGILCGDGRRVAARLDDDGSRRELLQHCTARVLSGGALAHGGFFLGPRGFYAALRELPDAERRQFPMMAISYINELYGTQSALKIAQRRDARFVNSTMMATLLGATNADGLADGRVVSGVGGQYNFVAMAHALPGARFILALRSTRIGAHGQPESNVLWNYAHTTIPRHLRDIIISEYGIADLRGRTDEQVIKAMLGICDSRFQEGLRRQAVNAGKLDPSYRIPEAQRANEPAALERRFALARARGLFSEFPFGTELSREEIALAAALTRLKHATSGRWRAIAAAAAAWFRRDIPASCVPALERMELAAPRTREERLWQRLLVRELLRKPA